MAAPEGNQFWKLRSKHGRDTLFESAEKLWNAACEYFEWCDSNPWTTVKTKTREKNTETEEIPVQRPYTLSGLCIYLDCSQSYFRNFKTKCNNDFLTVVTRIEEIIETQQFEGATVGAFNANIIARKLGLSDKQELTGKDGSPLSASFTIQPISTAKQTFASKEDEVHE